MAGFNLETLFRQEGRTRSAFLARVFGIFNEEIVGVWCRDERTPYNDLGRPTLYEPGSRWSTLDFALVHRDGGNPLVTEMKCELAWDNFKYLQLVDAGQLDHHKGVAFKRFLTLAHDSSAHEVKVAGKPIAVGGTALVWGSVSEEGRQSVRAKTGIDVILSLEGMVNDLIEWRSEPYRQLIGDASPGCETCAGRLSVSRRKTTNGVSEEADDGRDE